MRWDWRRVPSVHTRECSTNRFGWSCKRASMARASTSWSNHMAVGGNLPTEGGRWQEWNRLSPMDWAAHHEATSCLAMSDLRDASKRRAVNEQLNIISYYLLECDRLHMSRWFVVELAWDWWVGWCRRDRRRITYISTIHSMGSSTSDTRDTTCHHVIHTSNEYASYDMMNKCRAAPLLLLLLSRFESLIWSATVERWPNITRTEWMEEPSTKGMEWNGIKRRDAGELEGGWMRWNWKDWSEKNLYAESKQVVDGESVCAEIRLECTMFFSVQRCQAHYKSIVLLLFVCSCWFTRKWHLEPMASPSSDWSYKSNGAYIASKHQNQIRDRRQLPSHHQMHRQSQHHWYQC